MNEFLPISSALRIAELAPCATRLKQLILNETSLGNYIKSFDRVSTNNDECYYIIIFGDDNKNSYSNIQTMHKKNGSSYKILALVDRKGCTEIRFNY